MTSEIRANTIKNRVGLGTIEYSNTGPVISGVTTAFNFKTGTSNLHSTGLNIFDLDVDGHTNLDNVSISGMTTISSSLNGEIFRIETSAGNPGGTQGLAYMGFDHFPASTKPAILIGCEEDGVASYKGNFVVKLKDASATDDDPVQRLKIDSSGRVIIGRASPYGSADADNLIVGDEAVNEHQGITILSHSGKYGGIYFGDGAGSNPTERGKIIYDHPNDQLRMGAGGNAGTHFYINASGYIGINQSPSARLDVKQDNAVAYNGRAQSISSGVARFLNESGHQSGGTYTGFQFNITGNSQNRICSIGMVSEASNTRNSSLVFATDDGTNRTEKLRITSNGRVLIGTTSAFATGQAYRLFQIGQADGGWINLARTATPGDGNHLGAIQGFARGADGNYHDTVAIDFKADGTPSNTSKPSKIEFYATPSGSTSKELKKTIRQDGLQQNYVGTQPFDIYSTGSGEKYSLRLLNSDASAGNQIGIYFGPSNNVAGAYIAGYAYGDFASTANRDAGLRFGVRQNGTFKEVVRINDGGFFQATNIEGNYETHSFAADLGHQFNSNQRYSTTLWLRNTNANFENGMFRCAADRGANTAYHFITCTSGDLTDDEFRVRGDGKVYGDNNYTVGADYAEYFEWSDGNTSNQDRRGMTVVLDGNKVKLSTSSDSADNIIGVVSGSPSVVGDSSWSAWSQKYLKDDYNQYILDSDGYRQLNSSYDDTKTYTPRAERQEWDAIGMVGKLRIVKGQKTGTRWIKMRDISDTVEEWLVR